MNVTGSSAAETFNVNLIGVFFPPADTVADHVGINIENGNGAASAVLATDTNYEVATRDVEDIFIDTGAGADVVMVTGTLNGTGLATSTITVEGGTGNDADIVDARGLISNHGIVFNAGGGDDVFYSSAVLGNDTFIGGDGIDTIDFSGATRASTSIWPWPSGRTPMSAPTPSSLSTFLNGGVRGYDDLHDDLAGDATSRLSSYLRFGCISPLELAEEAGGRRGGAPFVRQLCWRDFHHQVLAAFPQLPQRDYRHRGDRWSRSDARSTAWKEGRTGYPIVDAGMRQLAEEGYMHNRARLITASFLTKDLYLDWREGARHFWDLLADGDIANNAGNWQWVAGTGNDTRPNRVFNPIRQAQRFDPDGDYVRRWVPELAGIDGRAVHEPWRIGPLERSAIDYPEPVVDHAEAASELKARRSE